MSLEAAIQENTAAINKLVAALAAGAAISTAATSAAATTAKEPEAKKSDAQTASSAPGVKPQSEAPKDDAQGKAEEPAALDYEKDVKPRVLQLSKEKGRDPTVALLQRFGVQKATELKPEQYARFISDIDRIFAGTYDPEKADLSEVA